MIQKIITICNAKGGVGKTTSTASIGACMALMGKKVLLIDLDGQANLTLYYIPNDSEIEVSIFDSLISVNSSLQLVVDSNMPPTSATETNDLNLFVVFIFSYLLNDY